MAAPPCAWCGSAASAWLEVKQIIQSYRTGAVELVDVPAPQLKRQTFLVRTVNSLVSVGTERYMLDLARKTLVGKMRSRPDLVRQALSKVQTEGLLEAWRQAMGRLDNPVPLGYSAAGVIVDSGLQDADSRLRVGDRVACAGSAIASHAEILRVPHTLAAKIPDGVTFEAASFVALGAIAIHAVRMADVTFGDRVVVLGLGLLGQLAAQILRVAGCTVVGMDPVEERCRLADELGADATATTGHEILAVTRRKTDGHGADAVIVFAATERNEPIELAAEVARERGRIIVPGLVGLDIPRKIFYEKELNLAVSRAWGPGMYDPDYEAGESDYPLPFVRWTARRNMAHFLEMLANDHVRVDHLVTHRFPLDRAVEAYETILSGREPFLGVLLTYERQVDLNQTVVLVGDQKEEKGQKRVTPSVSPVPSGSIRIGLIGAGLFAKGTLLPALTRVHGATLRALATSTGISAAHVARRYGLAYCTTDVDVLLQDPEIDLIMILTRHDSHAPLICKALASGKHVFVEKPMAINMEQLRMVFQAFNTQRSRVQLMVGFNRRFAPTARFAAERLARVERPLVVTVRVNLGLIPPRAWAHDPEEGGGSIIGEVCHFVDLIQALTRSLPVSVYARAVSPEVQTVVPGDNVVITMTMADGSVGTIVYTALGDKAYPRERVETFGGGAVCAIDNFKRASWTQGGRQEYWGGLLGGVDRGHRAEMRALVDVIRNGAPPPVEFEEYVYTTLATFAVEESLRKGEAVAVDPGSALDSGAS